MKDGLVVVDKAAGCTSHDVVGKLRKIYGQRRVGHAGTLDPDATGVLLVGLGRVTRLMRFLQSAGKSYRGRIVFGVATDTLDASGAVLERAEMPVSRAQLETAVCAFTGDIEQVPPMVSALRVGGRRLHELARAGVEVDRDPRPVTVDRFALAATNDLGVLAIDVTCSGGTYVRTLAADLGRLLGGGAHLRDLRRTAVGEFTIEDAGPPETAALLPVETAVRTLSMVVVDHDVASKVANGRVLPR